MWSGAVATEKLRRCDRVAAVSRNELPYSHVARRYVRARENYRNNEATRFALRWTLVLVVGVIAANLWFAFTEEGRATWLWLAS